jgi:hypothetical protein
MSESITLRIDAEPHNRIARVHEALRDLGLELCVVCNIWKGAGCSRPVGEFPWISISCTTCCPLPPGEAESGEGRGGGALPTELATAIREVAR